MITYHKLNIHLQFDEETGVIRSLKDGKHEYIGEQAAIFKIGLRDVNGEAVLAEMNNMNFLYCEKKENSFKAVYEGCNMEVTILAEISDSIEWRIEIELKDNRILEWVNFPQIVVPNDLKDNNGQSRILWGFNEGGIVDDLAYKENGSFCYREPQYPSISSIPIYPAIVESQFMAYYSSEGGLYFGAHDIEDNIKGIDFYRYKSGIMLQMKHFCGVHAGKRYEMNFPMLMKFFRGEWQDAAQIYKDWFKEKRGNQFIPICKNNMLPDWYAESPVVITYPVRGRHDGDIMNPNKMFPYCNALEHVERLEQELQSKIMVILMHWEGTAPWAPPYVWPPYGGEDELKIFIDALHERGDVLGVYCSGMGWTQYSRLVEDYNREKEFADKKLKNVMCLSPEQELPYSNIVPEIRAGYDMCPSQSFVTEVLKSEVKSMISAGIDYIQLLDQNHGGTSYFCYSKEHGHPPVPGKWQVDAVKHMLDEIVKETGKVLLGCESAAAESYIPWLLFSDNRYHLNYGVGRPVPLYAYLYHEYVNNFMGNQVCIHAWIDHKKSPENLLERMAYAFAAGDMLTLILNENGEITWNWGWREVKDIPNQQNVIEFVRNVNKWRHGIGKKYLYTGSMVKPYKVNCDKNIIFGKNGHEFLIEKLHISAWEATDGMMGQFLINYNTEDTECEIHLPEGSYRLYENTDSFMLKSGGQQTIKVKRLSAVLIERT